MGSLKIELTRSIQFVLSGCKLVSDIAMLKQSTLTVCVAIPLVTETKQDTV